MKSPIPLMLALLPTAVVAEEIQLSPIDVNTSVESSLTAPNLVQAESKALATAGAVSVLDAERYRKGRAAGQDDVLKLVPGVFVQSDNGADDTRISIRGSGLSSRSFGRGISSFQDGIPLGRLDSGTTAQLVDVLAYDHIEVLRGANGLSLGSSSLGGAINYHSKTGHNASPFLGRLTLGKDGYSNAQVASGQVLGDADYFISLSSLQFDGFRENQEVDNLRLNANFGYRINDNIENRTYLIIADANTELAGTVLKSSLEADREKANTRNVDVNADRNWKDTRIANKTTLTNGNQTLELSIYATKTELDHLPTPFTGIIDNEYTQGGSGIRYSVNTDNNDFVVGVRMGYQDNDEERFRYLNGGKDKGDKTHDANFKVNQYEIFAENEYRFTQSWAAIAGFKYLESERKFTDRIINTTLAPVVPFAPPFPDPQPNQIAGDQSYDLTFRGFSPKLGARFNWAEQQYAFANVAKSLGMPSSSELNTRTAGGLSPLKEQEATTFELGAKGRSDKLNWEATYYVSKIDDELLDNVNSRNQTIIENFDETRHEGIEAGAEWIAGENLLQEGDTLIWSGVYNWSDFTVEKFAANTAIEGNKIPRVPEHTFYAEAEYIMANGFSITPNVRFVDEYETTYSNTGGEAFDTDSYSLVGLKVAYDTGNGLSAFIDLRNLNDVVYASDASPTLTPSTRNNSAAVVPGQGRSAYIGLQYQM